MQNSGYYATIMKFSCRAWIKLTGKYCTYHDPINSKHRLLVDHFPEKCTVRYGS